VNQANISAQAATGVITANVASIFQSNDAPKKMIEIFTKLEQLMEIYCIPMKEQHPRTLAFVVTQGVTATDPYEAEMQSMIPMIEECFLVKGRVSESALAMLETFCPDVGISAHISAPNGRNLICFHNGKRQGLRYESLCDKVNLSFIPPLRNAQ
jgi:hypothetical protein